MKNELSLQERVEKLYSAVDMLDSSLRGRIVSVKLALSLSAFLPRISRKAAPCQQSVKFISTFSEISEATKLNDVLLFTTDPITNNPVIEPCIVNIVDKNTATITCASGGRTEKIFNACQHRMPTALCIGYDPALKAAAESTSIPSFIAPLVAAGFMREKPFLMKPCLTQKVDIPVDVDIVIEGYVQKHDGIFHISCTSHKKKLILPLQ